MTITDEQKLSLFRNLLRAYRMDEYACRRLKQGAIKLFWHSSAGMEAVGVGGGSMLALNDSVWYHYPGHGPPYLLGRWARPQTAFPRSLAEPPGCPPVRA